MKKYSIQAILVFILLINLFVNPFSYAQISPHSNTQIIQISEFAPYSQSYEDSSPHQIEPQEECRFRFDFLQRGASKDGIPSIDNPKFVDPDHDTAPVDPREKVIGVVIDGIARAYPYNILNWHEIVNDEINGNKVSITYCPLTGSGILYPTSTRNNTELGVSGLLYENNLVFYERDSGAHWTQMGGFVVKGAAGVDNINYTETVETTWETWLKLHPDTKVLSTQTSKPRSYDRYPYGSYRTDSSIYFPTTFNNEIEPYNLYHEKELTHIIQFDDKTLLLPFEELAKIPILNHNFVNQDLLTIYLQAEDLVLTYSSNLNGTILNFTSYEDIFNIYSSEVTLDLPLFEDNFENIWNFNGLAVAGPLIGTQLKAVPTYNAFWFAASTFFFDASILIINNGELEITTIEVIETQTSGGVTSEVTNTITSVVHSSFSVNPEVQDQGFLPLSLFYVVALFTLTIIRYKKHKIKN